MTALPLLLGCTQVFPALANVAEHHVNGTAQRAYSMPCETPSATGVRLQVHDPCLGRGEEPSRTHRVRHQLAQPPCLLFSAGFEMDNLVTRLSGFYLKTADQAGQQDVRVTLLCVRNRTAPRRRARAGTSACSYLHTVGAMPACLPAYTQQGNAAPGNSATFSFEIILHARPTIVGAGVHGGTTCHRLGIAAVTTLADTMPPGPRNTEAGPSTRTQMV